MRTRRIGPAVAAIALAAAKVPSAHAIDINAGDWKVSIDGNVNASYIYSNCDSSANDVSGGLACVATGPSSAVSNGLLPAALTINGATIEDGYDIGFTFGLYPGISTNDGGSPNLQNTAGPTNTALGTSGLDVRQVFVTFGTDHMGTIMAGRNYGLFASDVILNDMTLLGVGAGNGAYAAPANTSLGSIGLGYIYTDWLAQIDYSTPEYHGAKLTLGIFDPLNTLGDNQPVPTNKNVPGFQGKLSYTVGPLYLSSSFLYQKQEGTAVSSANPAGVGYDTWAFDLGGKYDMGPLEVLGWYYHGVGIGTTALFDQSNDSLGNPRTSDGFLTQATYQLGRLKLGVNYGQSRLGRTNAEFSPLNIVDTAVLVEKNQKWTGGAYYNLTHSLTLVAEFTYIESLNQLGQKNESNNVDVGVFLKF